MAVSLAVLVVGPSALPAPPAARPVPPAHPVPPRLVGAVPPVPATGTPPPVPRGSAENARGDGVPAPGRGPARPWRITVVASGDVLLHEALHSQAARDARTAGRTGYLFDPIFASVRPVVSAADVAICHLETPLGAPDGPFTGYPLFRVPPSVVDTLARTGYDSCSTASNHTIDDGTAGVARTLDALDRAGVRHAGSHRSAAEAATPTMLRVRGVTVAHLAYTFSLNGLVRPADKPWLVNELDAAAVLAEARRARAAGAEIVIASLHWGTEYQHEPDGMQLALARRLLGSPDLDLILGHHAHVVQPFGRVGDKWVVYGMGNQVAWQNQAEVTRDGVMARMTFRELAPGRWRVVRAEALPTWMSLGDPARLVYVPDALADPATPPGLRAACLAARRRIAAVVGM